MTLDVVQLLVYGWWIVASLCAIPVGWLTLQVLAGASIKQSAIAVEQPETATNQGVNGKTVFLVPAHDEATVIARTIGQIRAQLRDGDCILVVADNCRDGTATLAREAGAEVSERFSDEHRGKGYALDHGLRQLAHDPPDVLIIVDADCDLMPGAAANLRAACQRLNTPVQALYLMRPADERVKSRFAAFAWRVKNGLRPSGSLSMGLPCQLMGTGMAFPWHQISRCDLATGHIVEDMKLGIDLTLQGYPVMFAPNAQVVSQFPSDEEAQRTQRTRWEHGHLSTLRAEVPRLLHAALVRRDIRVLSLAVDLAVPPLALLAMLVLTVAATGLVLAFASSSLNLLAFAVLLPLVMLIATTIAWYRVGRDLINWREMLSAPWYALRKAPIYLAYAVNRQSRWIRTRREGE